MIVFLEKPQKRETLENALAPQCFIDRFAYKNQHCLVLYTC